VKPHPIMGSGKIIRTSRPNWINSQVVGGQGQSARSDNRRAVGRCGLILSALAGRVPIPTDTRIFSPMIDLHPYSCNI